MPRESTLRNLARKQPRRESMRRPYGFVKPVVHVYDAHGDEIIGYPTPAAFKRRITKP